MGGVRNFMQLVQAASDCSSSGKVVVSSVCPRTDNNTAQERSVTLNTELTDTCVQNNSLSFVNNDVNFITSDGSINDGYLSPDGLHLSRSGTNRLAKNLGLAMKSDDVTRDRHSARRPTAPEHPGRQVTDYQRRRQSVPNRDNPRNSDSRDRDRPTCYNCGDRHPTDRCRYGHRIRCYKCNGLGHKSYNCRDR